MQVYIVKKGDSLSSIARDVLGDLSRWPEIARLNQVQDVNRIVPGMMLTMPAPPTDRGATNDVDVGFDFRSVPKPAWAVGALLLLLFLR